MNGRAQKFRFLPMALLGVVVPLLGGSAFWLIRHFLESTPPSQKRVVQEIHVIRPPPPPPDQPPPPPPPPEEEVKVSEPPPEPSPANEPPPGEQLGLGAEGGAGTDGFGLVGRPGGHDLLAAGGSAYAWYGGLLKDKIRECFEDDKEARKGSYSIRLQVWVQRDGTIERIALVQSTGDRNRDRAIEQKLGCVNRLAQAPPADMPQPVTVSIVSRV